MLIQSISKLRLDFPFLINNNLIYFDNAATTQKPKIVLDSIYENYAFNHGPLRRGIYDVAEKATQLVEDVRNQVARYLNAKKNEIIFCKNTTDAINLVATSWLENNLKKGDEIVVTELEHHANFVVWQQMAIKKQAIFKVISIDENGYIEKDSIEKNITKNTKFISISMMSNSTGNSVCFQEIIKVAKLFDAKIMLDAAQYIYEKIDVKQLDIDFLAFSAHKMYGPLSVGILYVKESNFKEMSQYQYGGGAVYSVSKLDTIFLNPPFCFEPGTLAYPEIIGFSKALNYLESISQKMILDHFQDLINCSMQNFKTIKNIRLLLNENNIEFNRHIISFVSKNMHAHDIAAFLNSENIAVRAGNHCAQPLALKMKYDASIRISFAVYNSIEELEFFFYILKKII